MRRLLDSLVVVVVSTVVGLAAGEVLVRALFKERTVMFPRYHTGYHYGEYTLRGIRPNARFWHRSVDGAWEFVTNGKGLRDHREHAYQKAPGTLRVLVLGDSHTQGYEVRQHATYAAVLERYLSVRGVDAEVLNAGVSGFSTAEALAYLEHEGHRYQPDVVVLGFYANDFEDNLKAGLFALEEGAEERPLHLNVSVASRAPAKLVRRKYEHIPGVYLQDLIYAIPGVQWLGENSYFYSLLFNQVWVQAKRALRDRAVRADRDGGEFEYAVATTQSYPPHAVALALALVERMQQFCASRGIRLIVVDIPQPVAPYRAGDSLPSEAAKWLRDAKIELLPTRALLEEFGGAVEMHLPAGHRHISEFTHAAIGVELGRRIDSRLLGTKASGIGN